MERGEIKTAPGVLVNARKPKRPKGRSTYDTMYDLRDIREMIHDVMSLREFRWDTGKGRTYKFYMEPKILEYVKEYVARVVEANQRFNLELRLSIENVR